MVLKLAVYEPALQAQTPVSFLSLQRLRSAIIAELGRSIQGGHKPPVALSQTFAALYGEVHTRADWLAFLYFATPLVRTIYLSYVDEGGNIYGTCFSVQGVRECLNFIADRDPTLLRVVELYYFAELSVLDIAAALGFSAPRVETGIRLARAWLQINNSRQEISSAL